MAGSAPAPGRVDEACETIQGSNGTTFGSMLSALEELAREVGRDLLERSRQTADSMGVVWKGENDPVTLADRAAHEMVARALPSFAPGIPLVSEEDESRPVEGDSFWSLDPVDGTQEFMDHLGEWAFQLALVRDERPVLAVLAIPSRDVLYLAEKGRGCCAGRLSEPGLTPFLSHAPVRRERLVLTRSLPRRPALRELLERHHARDHVLLGGVGYKVHAILSGEADTYFASPGTLHAWDLAAPLLVAQESGLVARCTDGSELVVPSHRDGLAQGVLFTRPEHLGSNLSFFANRENAELLARREPR